MSSLRTSSVSSLQPFLSSTLADVIFAPLQLENRLKSSGLWGTIVPNVFKPSVFLQIQFKDATVELGNSIEVEKAQDEPKVGFVSNVRCSFFPFLSLTDRAKEREQEPTNEKQDDHLLLLIDPDAPSRNDPKWGPFLHWIQPGLKPLSIDEIASVADTGEGAKEGGDDAVWVKKNEKAKVDYLGPAPPEGTGYARLSSPQLPDSELIEWTARTALIDTFTCCTVNLKRKSRYPKIVRPRSKRWEIVNNSISRVS